MKKITLFAVLFFALSGCAYTRIGTMTIVSTRNYTDGAQYELKQARVSGKARVNRGQALEQAIEEATKIQAGGDHLRNASIYIRRDGRKIKVVGDSWGLKK